VTVQAAKTQLSRLIEQALAGEAIIARGGGPAVRLVPVAPPKPRRRFGSLKVQVHIPDGFLDPLPWRRSVRHFGRRR
jgi:antitoxin (DNA-binding transcriptional repressor) of toxin-antitoxin stability system